MNVADYKRNGSVWFYKIGLDGSDHTNKKGWKLMTLHSITERFNESTVGDTLFIFISIYFNFDSRQQDKNKHSHVG